MQGRETLLNLGPRCWLHRSLDKRSWPSHFLLSLSFPSWCPGVRLTTSSSPGPPFPVWECCLAPFSGPWLRWALSPVPPTPSLPASMVPPVQSVGSFLGHISEMAHPLLNFWGSPLLQDETQVLMLWALGSWLPLPFCLLTTSGCWQFDLWFS